MERIRGKVKKHHIISAFAVSGLAAAFFNFNSQPLFQNTDNFVLFASEELKLEQDVQVSSGDLGSNKNLDIEKDVIISGNLFADRITIDKNTTVNGNASFNKLKLHKDAQILGAQTKPVQLPIGNLPEITEFQVGTQDFRFEGQNNTLTTGNYRDIVVEKSSRLELSGGIYNLRKLELKENSTLIFNASTTINIQLKLRGKDKVLILPGLNLKPDDLKINYLGIRPKKEKEEREEDDNEIDSEMDSKEKKDHKARRIGRPIVFGKESFLNFKLLAPKASVHIRKESMLRGQVLVRKIKVGKDSILSREEIFEKESDPTKLITVDGVEFIVNEIILLLTSASDISEAAEVAKFVGGSVTGSVSSIGLYKIEVNTNTATELQDVIGSIELASFSFVLSVSENALMAPR